MVDLLEQLRARGLAHQVAGEETLGAWLAGDARTVYCGFDPTADSLHIGSLVPLLTLRRFQCYGHRPIALVGGATGLVGDPSFKAAERRLNTSDVVEGWVERIRAQVSHYIDFDPGPAQALVVNNLDWTGPMPVLEFLRDVGKHFSVNAMIHKESVRQRLDRDGEGISFTEFSYMLLQAFDFSELYRRHGCSLQIGGSDQWGNITAGIDLTRRLHRAQVYGLTLPLITRSDGAKFGKTEAGTVWLDPAKTSPYAFFQFWLNTADADVYRFLRLFTFLPLDELAELERSDAERAGRPEGQGVLAREVTRLVHGPEGLAAAERITGSLFEGVADGLAESDFEQLRLDGMPASSLDAAAMPPTLTQLLVEAGMAASGKQVKDALGRGAVTINGEAVDLSQNAALRERFTRERALHGRFFLVQMGRKKYHLFELPR